MRSSRTRHSHRWPSVAIIALALALTSNAACTRNGDTRSMEASSSAQSSPSSTPSANDGLPPPTRACFVDDEAPPRAVTAVSSRAGSYSPNEPIIEDHLNWMVDGVGCVEWPRRPGIARAECGGDGALPVVHRRLCMQ